MDFLVSFVPDADWTLLDHFAMLEELGVLVGRPVDLATRRSIERGGNWIRREEILSTAEPLFAA